MEGGRRIPGAVCCGRGRLCIIVGIAFSLIVESPHKPGSGERLAIQSLRIHTEVNLSTDLAAKRVCAWRFQPIGVSAETASPFTFICV